MRRLRRGIPRAFASHKSVEGRLYRTYVEAVYQRLGVEARTDASFDMTVRECGRLVVELQACGHELAIARQRKRHRDAARLRKQLTPMRTQLIAFEERLEVLAVKARHSPSLREVLGGR